MQNLEKLLLREIRCMLIFFLTPVMVESIIAAGLGGYGGSFHRAPVGASAFSLGGAHTSSPKMLCVWWNPAALSHLKKKILVMGTGYRPLGRTEGYTSFEFLVPPRMAMGVSLLYRGDPFIDNLVDEQEYPLEDGSYATLSGKIGISYLIKRNLSAGFNFSIYYQRLPTGFKPAGDLIYSSATALGGFDIGIQYRFRKNITFGLVFKNILGNFNWEFRQQDDFNPMYQDTLPSTITFGQEIRTHFLGKPFIWTCDVIGYMYNANFKALDNMQAVLNNGIEWQRWDIFYIRAGIRDVVFNRDLIYKTDIYKKHFSLAMSLGFSLDLSTALKGKDIILNYGFSNDKVGAGLDQQLDFVVSF
jgi:hypothetical protein